ncbi:hypothetical protein QQ977_11170 [Natrialbaceae archaeon AArc-T1-2]|nr:hypothetical protein [Natrialbaceae archaeon AArc-T1-2]WIV66250.1 hypothetical protein QQ977_11170 [Natrialbaceae archaeon AArc-T1-2]
MDSDTASRGSLLGLAGLASLCCVGAGTVAVTGGAAAGGLGATLGQTIVTMVTLGIIWLVVRRRTGCSACET